MSDEQMNINAVTRRALHGTGFTRGRTHNFYLYPARFSPEVARAVIQQFTEPDDLVLDPFMGGGTAVVEALVLGRRCAGVDISSLAHFITKARTTPLSPQDKFLIRRWSELISSELSSSEIGWIPVERPTNLPAAVAIFMSGALALLGELEAPRQRAFARCALLRLGQYHLESKNAVSPRRRSLARQYPALVDKMLVGLDDFVESCREAGIRKDQITGRRFLGNYPAADLATQKTVASLDTPKLVFTSPPYPGVHVLYHRWQYRSRRETPAPFWIANVPDGHGEMYYTGGSRTPTGLRRYFGMVEASFRAVAGILDKQSTVVQLVGFSDGKNQLPRYLRAMSRAGFQECLASRRPRRVVPNRRWYAKQAGNAEASTEILLMHRLASS